jgi:soluble lytic murein transglycosylase-like protein
MWRLAGVMVIGAALSGAQAAAQDGAPAEADFTFRRIGVPPAGTTRRLTIQIDPEDQRRRLAALPQLPAPQLQLPAAAPSAPDPWQWFWDRVPAGADARAGRFEAALAALAETSTDAGAMRLQQLQDIAAAHGSAILAATVGTEVSPALVLAVIAVESGGRANAVSGSGAVGLMQLIPATAARFEVADSLVAAQNIGGGVAYLNWLMRRFGRDPVLVLAAYNAGENAVDAAGGVPPYAETRGYVPKVLAAWVLARGLCLTPPELVSDGCVFAVKG